MNDFAGGAEANVLAAVELREDCREAVIVVLRPAVERVVVAVRAREPLAGEAGAATLAALGISSIP